ncbi:MAG TPA: VWA domain-containing protein [Pyrinomonadaceae bacterium]|nr:VWA domain-containing protein [Pyrinomonadaceae bacterium]
MKQAARIGIFLLALVCATAPAPRAQSGRRSKPSASDAGTPSAGKTSSGPATNSAPEGDVVNDGALPEGETVEGDVVRVNTALVTVPVSVMDRNGKYIPNLGREDFHIYEDGAEQRISYFGTVDQPFTVVLLIDTSRSTDFRLEDMQNAAIAFVNQLKPEDRVIVISFDDDIDVLTKATSDRAELVRAIRRTRTGGGTRLYDAVDTAISKALKKIEGRKAVVLFTDGVDTTSRTSYQSTVRKAEEFDALFYPVAYNTSGNIPHGTWGSGPGSGIILGLPGAGIPGIGGSGGGASPEEYRLASAYLHELAEKTGGRYYRGGSLANISEAFAQVAEELRRQYSLGYYPKQSGQSGQRRQIKVRVNQPGLVVQARDSYIYSQKGAEANPTKEPQPKPEQPETHLGASR